VPAVGAADADLAQLLDHREEIRRLDGEVEHQVLAHAHARLAEFVHHALVGLRVVEIAHDVIETRLEALEHRGIETVAEMFLDALLEEAEPFAQGPVAPGEGEEAQVGVQPVGGFQLVERRQQLARGEVAGGAEDDEITGSEISHNSVSVNGMSPHTLR
jgi:hypothetical protein